MKVLRFPKCTLLYTVGPQTYIPTWLSIIDENISLDDLFIKFGSDKGSLDGKKTYSYIKLKDKNKFSNLFLFVIYAICLNNKFEGLALKYSNILFT